MKIDLLDGIYNSQPRNFDFRILKKMSTIPHLNAEKLSAEPVAIDVLKAKIPSVYASKANPTVKETIIRYDDKNGPPTTDDDIF